MHQHALPGEVFATRQRDALERALSAYLPTRRWFGSKARRIDSVTVRDAVELPNDTRLLAITLRGIDRSVTLHANESSDIRADIEAVLISMRDNFFVERLWRSVKYEEVYLRAYDSVSDARASLCYGNKLPPTVIRVSPTLRCSRQIPGVRPGFAAELKFR